MQTDSVNNQGSLFNFRYKMEKAVQKHKEMEHFLPFLHYYLNNIINDKLAPIRKWIAEKRRVKEAFGCVDQRTSAFTNEHGKDGIQRQPRRRRETLSSRIVIRKNV